MIIPAALLFGSIRRYGLSALCLLVTLSCLFSTATAQLATSFYNITSIQTKVLPNAVQITIRTDGTVAFGGDRSEFIDFDQWDAKPTTSFRIRLLRARSRLPAFIDIGSYPFDSAVVSLGTAELADPYFRGKDYGQPEPRVDIQFRFYVPIYLKRFIVDRQSRDSYGDSTQRGMIFAETLMPRDVEVTLGDDRRSIVITVISDHADAGRAMNIKRSPVERYNHRQSVTRVDQGTCRIDALHTPLAELLYEYSTVAGVPITARTDAQKIDVSLLLPSVKPDEFLQALRVGYGLVIMPRTTAEGGGYSIGRDGPMSTTERIPLSHLKPENARLLFPDFLLSTMRADNAGNALIVTGTPDIISRLRRDIARLDQPRSQVRVDAHLWEFTNSDDANNLLRLSGAIRNESASFDPAAGLLSVAVNSSQRSAFTVSAEEFVTQGRARLVAEPHITVLSGQSGTLFMGQQRFITVLREQWWGQDVESIKLNIGYSLTVTPTVGASDDITLDINPKISTIDSVEDKTGLPTLGIRETNTTQRILLGETILIAGMDIINESRDNRRLQRVPAWLGSHTNDRTHGYTVVMVTAHKE